MSSTSAPVPEAAPRRPQPRLRGRLARSPLPLVLWVGVVVVGVALLVTAMIPVGPDWLSGAGAITVATAYAWALAARTGGRPVVFASLALGLGAVVVALDQEPLRTGAAVVTCVIAAVLGVMATVPAVRFAAAARETSIAVLIAFVGGIATVGFRPVITLARFEYVTLGISLVAALVVVYRLGAGLHGLGRRGIVIVVVGTIAVALTLAYAELLRRYGTPALVTSLLDGVRWSRGHLGAFPRPIETVLGVPALAWGCHMRARRRQGWWVCAFGVAATAPAAQALLNPAVSMLESTLAVGYGLLAGLAIGFLVIRIDLAFTAPRGRRGRRAEEESAHRPEPARQRPLF